MYSSKSPFVFFLLLAIIFYQVLFDTSIFRERFVAIAKIPVCIPVCIHGSTGNCTAQTELYLGGDGGG